MTGGFPSAPIDNSRVDGSTQLEERFQEGVPCESLPWERLQSLMNSWFIDRLWPDKQRADWCPRTEVESVQREFNRLVQAKLNEEQIAQAEAQRQQDALKDELRQVTAILHRCQQDLSEVSQERDEMKAVAANKQCMHDEEQSLANRELLSLKNESTALKSVTEEQKREISSLRDQVVMLDKQLQSAENNLEVQQAKTTSQMECQAGRFKVEKMQLEGVIAEQERLAQSHAQHLEQCQKDRSLFAKELEEYKQKYKNKRRGWHEERDRLLRCLDTQTKTNASHLQEISRQLGPNGSIRQSLDLSFSQAGSDWGTPRSSASMRRHSFANPGGMHGRMPNSSICSSPRMVDSLGLPVHVSFEARPESPHSAYVNAERRYSQMLRSEIEPVPEAENSHLCIDGGDSGMFGNENEAESTAMDGTGKDSGAFVRMGQPTAQLSPTSHRRA